VRGTDGEEGEETRGGDKQREYPHTRQGRITHTATLWWARGGHAARPYHPHGHALVGEGRVAASAPADGGGRRGWWAEAVAPRTPHLWA